MKYLLYIPLFISIFTANAQVLHLKNRNKAALTGSEFGKIIADTNLTLLQRESRIYNEIKSGNVPQHLRKLIKITDTLSDGDKSYEIAYWVLPDYIAIGSNEDFLYCPTTPILAQRIADLTNCSLPTKKIVDAIYQHAAIQLSPQPMPPTKEMSTVPVFIAHSDKLHQQLAPFLTIHAAGALTAGNKKDIVISNKIYSEKTPKVVIYGWHKLDGKAIQPLYNKHTNLWVDYSHGVRLIQNKVFVNGKKTTLKKVLSDPILHQLLSDEGILTRAYYPVFSTY